MSDNTDQDARAAHLKARADASHMALRHAPEAISCLLRVMRSGKKDADRVRAAKELLDRGLGGIVTYQDVTINGRVSADPISADEWVAAHCKGETDQDEGQ